MSKIIIIFIISLLGDNDFCTRENATKYLSYNINPKTIPYMIEYGVHSSDPEIRFRSKEILKKKFFEYKSTIYSIPIFAAIEIIDSDRYITIEDAAKINRSPYIKSYLVFIIATRLWYAPSDYENIFSDNNERIMNCVNNNKRLYRDRKVK